MGRIDKIIFIIIFFILINSIIIVQAENIKKTNNSFAKLSYSPESHDFGDMTKDMIDTTTFEIWNSDCCTLNYELEENRNWIEVYPASGSSIGEHDIITITIDTSYLSCGDHEAEIYIHSGNGEGVFTVYVNIITSRFDITVDEAYDFLDDLSDGIQIPIDVRTENEWLNERIDTKSPENPRHHDYNEWSNPAVLNDFLSEYEGEELIIYCASGGRSNIASDILVDNNFNGIIYNMLGGISQWKNKGFPTIGQTVLDILDIKGGLGSISFKILNNGNYRADNITYNIDITGGLFQGINFNFESDGSIQIQPDNNIIIDTKNQDLIFGIGPISISIKTWANNADEIIIQKQGFILGIFIIIL